MVDANTNLAAASLTFSVLSFLVLTFGLIMWQFPDIANTIRGVMNIQSANAGTPGVLSNLSILAVIGGALSPDISLLIGFISDIMNGRFRYSVTSIVGIFAVLLHWLIARFIVGYTSPESVAVESAVSSVASAVTATVSPVPISETINIGVGTDKKAPTYRPGPPSVISSLPGGLGEPATSISPTERERKSGPGSVIRSGLNPSNIIPGARPSRKAAMRATDKMSGMSGGASYIQEKFNPCTIRGLGMFEVTNSPMGIAALSSIFMIYLLDMLTKRTGAQIGGYVGFSALVFALNLYAYKEAKCVSDTTIIGLLRGIALPTVIGLASGGIAYGVMKAEYPEFLPLDAQPFDDGTPGKPHAKCGQPSENEFVCDAYKDGKKISTAIVS